MLNEKELEQFVNGCANTVSNVLNDLEKMNIGLAKDKLYLLLKQSAQLIENIEKSKPKQGERYEPSTDIN